MLLCNHQAMQPWIRNIKYSQRRTSKREWNIMAHKTSKDIYYRKGETPGWSHGKIHRRWT